MFSAGCPFAEPSGAPPGRTGKAGAATGGCADRFGPALGANRKPKRRPNQYSSSRMTNTNNGRRIMSEAYHPPRRPDPRASELAGSASGGAPRHPEALTCARGPAEPELPILRSTWSSATGGGWGGPTTLPGLPPRPASGFTHRSTLPPPRLRFVRVARPDPISALPRGPGRR